MPIWPYQYLIQLQKILNFAMHYWRAGTGRLILGSSNRFGGGMRLEARS